MQLAWSFCFGLMGAIALSGSARPQDAAESLKLYAVHVLRPPKEAFIGYGVYLGNGYVITAAHVAGLSLWTDVQVDIAGKKLPAKVIKRGQFHNIDLTVVSVDDQELPVSLRLRRMTVCKNSPWPGEEVVVATPEGIARSHVISPFQLPLGMSPKFQTAISDVATTGNSGSGVFDAHIKCLLGIVSGVIRQNTVRQEEGHAVTEIHDVAKYFVPSPAIADFIATDLRF
jgi:Trypsin-like peptidase domain